MNTTPDSEQNSQGEDSAVVPEKTRSTFVAPASFIAPSGGQPYLASEASQDAVPVTEQTPLRPQPASAVPSPQYSYPNAVPQSQPHGGYSQQPHSPAVQYPGQPTPAQQVPAWARPYPQAGQASSPQQPKRRTGLIITSTALIAVLLGGAAGFGGAWLYNSVTPNQVQTIQGQSNITINDPENVNLVSAVVALAAPSVVTLSVTAGSTAGTGSGVIISEDGYVLTNNHVVTFDGVRAVPVITVKASDGTLYNATVVATDPVMDLAVIKLENASGLQPITFADSDALNVGQAAIAIGAPLGLEGTVTQGIISALNRSINVSAPIVPEEGDTQEDGDGFNFWNNTPELQNPNSSNSSLISLPVIQTDASINPGNSGGALLNSSGELIGINVAIATASSSEASAGSIGVGFSIPANLAKRVAEELIASQKASHGLLGATIRNTDVSDASPAVAGAYVVSVIDGAAADQIGLREGDIITRFNNIAISSSSDLTAFVRYLPAGATADIVYVRDGRQYTETVTLGEMAN